MLSRRRRPGPVEFAHDQDPRRAKKALRADQSWPTHKTAPVMPFEPMDVDRYEDLGFVVASQRGRLQTYWFVNRNGRWEWQGGTGGGGAERSSDLASRRETVTRSSGARRAAVAAECETSS